MRSDTTSGTPMSESNLPDWEQLLSAAAHLQEILPDATLGDTADSCVITLTNSMW